MKRLDVEGRTHRLLGFVARPTDFQHPQHVRGRLTWINDVAVNL